MFKKLFKKETTVQKEPTVKVTVSEDMKNQLRETPIESQLANDVKQWDAFLSNKEMALNDETYGQRQEIMKRIFMLVQSSELIKSSDLTNKSNPSFQSPTNDNAMPPPLNVASLLSHGGRLVIQVPPLDKDNPRDPNTLVNVVLGDPVERNRIVNNRGIATHSLNIVNGLVEEEELKKDNKTNYLKGMTDTVNKRHLGMDVGVSYQGAAPADGTNGHVYVYWMPPTTTTPGGMMIGVETCAPGKTNPYGIGHDTSATKNEFSPTGGTKFSSKQFQQYQNGGLILSPDHGLRINLSDQELTHLAQIVRRTDELDLSRPITISQMSLEELRVKTLATHETTHAVEKAHEKITSPRFTLFTKDKELPKQTEDTLSSVLSPKKK